MLFAGQFPALNSFLLPPTRIAVASTLFFAGSTFLLDTTVYASSPTRIGDLFASYWHQHGCVALPTGISMVVFSIALCNILCGDTHRRAHAVVS
jgi:uncharacterized membrane protein YfcA